MNSSTTTRAPGPSRKIASSAATAASTVPATVTPLPAARPSALTTIGAPCASTNARAACGSVKVWPCAVGAPQAAQISLVKAFDASSRAASRPGPSVATPPARSTSATPSASGASGPTITKSMACARQNARTLSPSRISSATQVASSAIPALPGAHQIRSHFGFCAKAQASACSRPPPPRIRMFTGGVAPLPDVALILATPFLLWPRPDQSSGGNRRCRAALPRSIAAACSRSMSSSWRSSSRNCSSAWNAWPSAAATSQQSA